MVREAIDDIRRFRRDRQVNCQKYKKLSRKGLVDVQSADIQVSDLIYVEKVCTCHCMLSTRNFSLMTTTL